jgi:tRNA dimethylallyltransferase
VRALVYGLAAAPPADETVRERHRSLVEERGRAALHEELARRDPESARRLNPNDFVRVSRALEVFESSGVPMSAWQAEHGFREPKYAVRLFGVARTKDELDTRIAARTRAMLRAGWVDEVRALIDRGYLETRAMRSVGYRQVAQALTSGRLDVELCAEGIYRATRVFARRQRTWLRDEPVRWLSADEARDARLQF